MSIEPPVTSDALRLDGKAVIVTGAGGGLGRSYALHAAAAGASVVVNDVDGEAAGAVVEQITAAGGIAVANAGSIADPDRSETLVRACEEAFGSVDGLVNNAGVYHEAMPWEEDPEDLRRIVAVNVLGSLLCGAAVARRMVAAGRGSIVNVSSGAALGIRRTAAYAATKGAIASLTCAWALDLAGTGVRVNCISPLARTAMTDKSPLTLEIVGEDRVPERIAPLVTYLLSDASVDITGQFVRFNGEQLHLVSPLRFAEPVVVQPRWSVEDVAAAFAGPLRDALQPFGQ